MSAGLIASVLNQLSSLIADEAKLLGGLGQHIQGVVDELEHMKAFLMFAEGREEKDPRLQVWIFQVQDVAYDIEDVVDEFMLLFCHRNGHGFYGHARKIFKSMKSLRARHQIAQKIEAIKSRIIGISEGHKRYQFEYGTSNQVSPPSSAMNNSWHDYRDASLLLEEAKLVGIHHPKQQLISQLLDGDSKLKVVSVLGMGGIGKTTLVKRVQEDADVKKEFDVLVWVTVSQTRDMKELLGHLIQQLHKEIKKPVPQEVDYIRNADQLKLFVKEFLQERKYLIVFDDVWDSQFLYFIKFALPEGNRGNRIILTTRIADVAHAEFQSYVHRMQPLSSEDSWTLFCKKTFNDNCCPAHLENVAKAILRKCEGLPLAISAIGGLLALKDKGRIDEWKIVELSLGDELEVSGKLDTVTKILSLSYNELPYHLKTCLLYASIFPEDYSIREEVLIRFWIAEGFVLEKRRMTKYEVACAYLHELTNRSLIQVSHAPFNRTIRHYRVHDLLREIILSKSSRQNFATTFIGEQRTWPKKVRRLAIHDLKSDTKSSIHFKHLRSLVIFKSEEPLSKSLLSELLCSGSRLLKVLDLQGTQLEEIPDEVFKLFHLRTLSLKETRVKTIPRSIGSLKNLEFLDLSFTKVVELPVEILKIEGLSHLIVFDCFDADLNGFKGPKNIGKLLSLEWLYHIEANEMLIREIGKLKQLKRLGITNLRREDGKQLCSSLGKLSNLEQLYLQALGDNEVLDLEGLNISLSSSLQNVQVLSFWGRLQKVPEVISSLHALTSMDLAWSRLIEDPLEPLQNLPNLQSLTLDDRSYEGERLCFKSGCFLKLENLCIWSLKGLRWLEVVEDAMPNLGRLDISCLESLEEFPWGIQHLRKLQDLNLSGLSDKVIDQLQNLDDESSEEYQRVAHIPKIMIYDQQHGWCRHPQYWKTRRESMASEEDMLWDSFLGALVRVAELVVLGS